ncbi:hypothetical protein BKA63DRAFT_524050 [Paraphoma chrysanthemicola]|nr:hypothetical protein BKA63DRAFT_524050 [Paraphoma chrysanthemicola]
MSSMTAGDILGLCQIAKRCCDLLRHLKNDEGSRNLPLTVRDRAHNISKPEEVELPAYVCTQFTATDGDSDEFLDHIKKELSDGQRHFHRISSNSTLLGASCKGTAWLDDRVMTACPANLTSGRGSKPFLSRDRLLSALQKHTSTLALATGQFACITAMHTYEFCNRANSSSSARHQSCLLHNSDFSKLDQWFQDFVNTLSPILSDRRNISTSTFVLSGMAWTALAIFQNHINERDRFQRSAVLIGLVTGFAMCLPSLSRPEEQQVIASVMAFCMTVTMLVSAFAHWVGAVVSGKKRVPMDTEMEDGDRNGRKDVQQYVGVEKETV